MERKATSDAVNHPSHYTTGKFEVIDVIEDWGLDEEYHLANVIKYIARAKHKGAFLQDLRKAMWYLDRRIKREEEKSDSRFARVWAEAFGLEECTDGDTADD